MTIKFRKPSAAEEKAKEECLKLMTEDRQQLLMRWPFIGSIIIRMDLAAVRDDRLETLCTDGDTIFADINFYMSLNKNERLFVLAHEVWHCAMLHFLRLQRRDRERFNIACDIEIFFILREEKMKVMEGPFFDPAWEGLSAEEIYEKLPEELEEKTPDLHLYKGDTIPSEDELRQEKGSEDREMVLDEDFEPLLAQGTAERIRGRVIAAAQQLERTQGKLPASVSALVERLQKPEMPWAELLKQFVSSCYGGKRRWLPPARRHVWQGIYLPGMRDQTLRAVVTVDTSGSTCKDRDKFLTELFSLMRSFGKFELTVLQCDAQVHTAESFSETNLPELDGKWEFQGGGGTNFVPAFEYVKEHLPLPDLFIYFTDGHGPAPQKAPPYPVLWVLSEGGQKPSLWGRAIRFNKD